MNGKQFKWFVSIVKSEIDALMASKGAEYAGADAETDRLANLKRIAATAQQTPVQVLLTLVMKHIDALIDFERRSEQPAFPTYREKFYDVVVYMYLLGALKYEESCNAGNHSLPTFSEADSESVRTSGTNPSGLC